MRPRRVLCCVLAVGCLLMTACDTAPETRTPPVASTTSTRAGDTTNSAGDDPRGDPTSDPFTAASSDQGEPPADDPGDVPLAGATFPARLSENHRQVLDTSGRPWALVGDAGWSSMVMLSAEERHDYLVRLSELGYNAVLVSVIENRFSDYPPFNVQGDAPFSGELFTSPPNPRYWEWVDDYVVDAERRGITVMMCVAYLGYTDEDGVGIPLADASIEQAFGYGAFVGERYTGSPNILWVMGGDRTDVSEALRDRVDAIARGIRSVDQRHLMTAHSADGALGSDVYGEYPWLDIDTEYDIIGNVVGDVHRAVGTTPVRPVMSIEGLYESDRADPLEPGDSYLRYQSWAAFMAGSFGHVFGNNPRWHFGIDSWPFPASWPWQLTLLDPDRLRDRSTIELGLLGDFAASWDWAAAHPDVDGNFVVRSEGSHVAAGRYGPGLGMVYVPDGTTVELDLSALAATSLSIQRFDPTDGTSSPVEVPQSNRLVASPTDPVNAGGAHDWVYVISGV